MKSLQSTINRCSMAALCALPFAIASSTAGAEEFAITAQFVPSLQDPTRNKFLNTTPMSGLCNLGVCGGDVASIATGLRIADRQMSPSSANMRHWHYAKIDAGWRDVRVTGPDGRDHRLQFRLNMLLQDWRPGFLQPPTFPGCPRIFAGGSGGARTLLVVALPEGITSCTDRPEVEGVHSVNPIEIGYELRAPDPGAMQNGTYTGSVRYSVGEGMDFDIGAGTYSDSEFIFNLSLKVEHAFKVELTPGSERVVLQPVGGWSTWIDEGRPPSRLQREVPFNISSSGEFKVRLECEHFLGEGVCGLRDIESSDASAVVPVGIDLTMPGMYDVSRGAPAVNYPLVAYTNAFMRFRSNGIHISNRPSKLRFHVDGRGVRRMLERPGSTWRGGVTVIFDAQP